MTALSADSARFLSLSLGFVPFAFCATQLALVRALPVTPTASATALRANRPPVDRSGATRDICAGTDARRALAAR